MARKERAQQLPPEDWFDPKAPNIIFDGSLLPEDPTYRYRHPPINPNPANYRGWWGKRHFFPEDDKEDTATKPPDHHEYWRKTGLLPDQSAKDNEKK